MLVLEVYETLFHRRHITPIAKSEIRYILMINMLHVILDEPTASDSRKMWEHLSQMTFKIAGNYSSHHI